MAHYFAIKSPTGIYSDFTKQEKTSINRFLRRQEVWDDLWLDYVGDGYVIETVHLVHEEAERLNRKLDYHRDSSKKVNIRERDNIVFENIIIEAPQASLKAAKKKIQEKPSAPEIGQRMEGLLSSSLKAVKDALPSAKDYTEDSSEKRSSTAKVEPLFDSNQADPLIDAEKNLANTPLTAQTKDNEEPSKLDTMKIDDPMVDEGIISESRTVRSKPQKINPVENIESKQPVMDSIPPKPKSEGVTDTSIKKHSESSVEKFDVPEGLVRDKTRAPVDINRFIKTTDTQNLNTQERVSLSIPKTKSPEKVEDNAMLMFPQFIASKDDDAVIAAEIPNPGKKQNSMKAGDFTDSKHYSDREQQIDYKEVAFSESGDELSAPRVVRKHQSESDKPKGNPLAGGRNKTIDVDNLKPIIDK